MADPAWLRGLDVRFVGDAASGDGLRRDWFGLVVRELIDPKCGLFGSRDNNHTIEPHQGSGALHGDHLVHFELLGKVAMVALANGEVVEGLSLSLPFRKLALGRALEAPQDLMAIDYDLYQNLSLIHI